MKWTQRKLAGWFKQKQKFWMLTWQVSCGFYLPSIPLTCTIGSSRVHHNLLVFCFILSSMLNIKIMFNIMCDSNVSLFSINSVFLSDSQKKKKNRYRNFKSKPETFLLIVHVWVYTLWCKILFSIWIFMNLMFSCSKCSLAFEHFPWLSDSLQLNWWFAFSQSGPSWVSRASILTWLRPIWPLMKMWVLVVDLRLTFTHLLNSVPQFEVPVK